MVDPANGQGTARVGEAYAAARELLRRAEEDAARIRADAERYVQQRHLEAELVVAKARRLLAVAEERAAAMTAPAPVPSAIDLTRPAEVPVADEPVAQVRGGRNGLDSILATAVNRAIARALPADG